MQKNRDFILSIFFNSNILMNEYIITTERQITAIGIGSLLYEAYTRDPDHEPSYDVIEKETVLVRLQPPNKTIPLHQREIIFKVSTTDGTAAYSLTNSFKVESGSSMNGSWKLPWMVETVQAALSGK